MRSQAVVSSDYPDLGEWPARQKGQKGKRLLADFLNTPAHLEAVRNFSKLWRPYRKVLDGELLMRFIYKGWFPKEFWEFSGQENHAA